MKQIAHIALALALAITTIGQPRQGEAASALMVGAVSAGIIFGARGATAVTSDDIDLKTVGTSAAAITGAWLVWNKALTMFSTAVTALTPTAGWWPAVVITSFGGPWGLLILDADSDMVHFKALEAHEASELALTESQRRAFNSNVDVFNLIANELTLSIGKDFTLDEVTEAWEFYLDELNVDTEARQALGSLTGRFISELEQSLK